jgi:flagellar biogenesis protein FliO
MTFQANRLQASASQKAAVSILDSFRLVLQRLGTFSRQIIRRKRSRRLQLCETVSLGNRGFVAVIGYQEQRFLVGGTSTSIVLLADLHGVSDCNGQASSHQGDNHQPDKLPGSLTSRTKFAEIAQDGRPKEAHSVSSC